MATDRGSSNDTNTDTEGDSSPSRVSSRLSKIAKWVNSRRVKIRSSKRLAPRAKRWNWVLVTLAVVGFSVLAAVIYLAPTISPDKHPRWAVVFELAERLADASLVAVGLALLVDLPAKIELMREVLYEASSHIIGRNLPADIREEVRTYLTTQFIRPGWLVDYRLTPIEGTAAVKLNGYLEGEIQNCGGQPDEFTFVGEVDESWLDIGKSKIIKAGMLRGSEKIFLTEPTDEENEKWLLPTGTIHFEQKEMIDAGEEVTTILECIEYRPNSYLHPLITSSMVRSITITVTYPTDQLTVDLTLSCGDDGKVVRRDFTEGSRWIINKPLLPGQSVITSWKPKQKPRSAYTK